MAEYTKDMLKEADEHDLEKPGGKAIGSFRPQPRRRISPPRYLADRDVFYLLCSHI